MFPYLQMLNWWVWSWIITSKARSFHFVLSAHVFKFSGKGELGTGPLCWMIAFLKAPVWSGYFRKNLKNAAWKCPVCFLHRIFFLCNLWFTALKRYPVLLSICFSIMKTCSIPKWLCFTNALFNPETESSWCWPQKFNSWKSRFSTHLDEWCHLDPILSSGTKIFWFLLNIWHHRDNSLNVSYHSDTCHICLEQSHPQLSWEKLC